MQHITICCLKPRLSQIWDYSSAACNASPLAAWNHRHAKPEISSPLHVMHHCLPPKTQANEILNYSSPAWHTKSKMIPPLLLIRHRLLPETIGTPNLKFSPLHVMCHCLPPKTTGRWNQVNVCKEGVQFCSKTLQNKEKTDQKHVKRFRLNVFKEKTVHKLMLVAFSEEMSAPKPMLVAFSEETTVHKLYSCDFAASLSSHTHWPFLSIGVVVSDSVPGFLQLHIVSTTAVLQEVDDLEPVAQLFAQVHSQVSEIKKLRPMKTD